MARPHAALALMLLAAATGGRGQEAGFRLSGSTGVESVEVSFAEAASAEDAARDYQAVNLTTEGRDFAYLLEGRCGMIRIRFLNDGGASDVVFTPRNTSELNYLVTYGLPDSAGAWGGGWNCRGREGWPGTWAPPGENIRCSYVRSGAFNWGGTYFVLVQPVLVQPPLVLARFHLRGITGRERVEVSLAGATRTQGLTTEGQDFAYPLDGQSAVIRIRFLDDGGASDVVFTPRNTSELNYLVTLGLPDSAGAWGGGWNCRGREAWPGTGALPGENSRCSSVRSGAFNWGSSYGDYYVYVLMQPTCAEQWSSALKSTTQAMSAAQSTTQAMSALEVTVIVIALIPITCCLVFCVCVGCGWRPAEVVEATRMELEPVGGQRYASVRPPPVVEAEVTGRCNNVGAVEASVVASQIGSVAEPEPREP